MDEALKRLPQEVVDARNQRLKRASDVSLKKAYLPKDLQAVQTPYKSYMAVRPAGMRKLREWGPLLHEGAELCLGGVLSQDMLARVVAENEEKARLGTGKTYDRSIP